jgi:hypothetical protein
MLQLFAFRRGAAATVAKACLCYQYRAGQRQQLYTLFPSFRPERSSPHAHWQPGFCQPGKTWPVVRRNGPPEFAIHAALEELTVATYFAERLLTPKTSLSRVTQPRVPRCRPKEPRKLPSLGRSR